MFSVLLALTAAMPIDRKLEVLPKDPRAALAAAGKALGARKIVISAYEFDGRTLEAIAALAATDKEPLLRAVREGLHRPIDLDDFIFFLDDVLAAEGLGDAKVVITADRGRHFGILLDPTDVFPKKKPKIYAKRERSIPIDDPPLQENLEPAKDFDPPGPRWAARFQQPATFKARLAELEASNPRFGKSMTSLVEQLEKQGAAIIVESAVRSRARGYLIYGSYYLSRARTASELERRLLELAGYNQSWGLKVPITWKHPDGFEATIEASRQMADTYGVDFATVVGAQRSDHYDGKAVDLVAVDLPRKLELIAPDGARNTFDLSRPTEPRDLNLTPALIEWIETHFAVKKLLGDYPHWKDPG